MKIKVEVTQEKIDEAKRMTCCSCPVAKSVNRDDDWPQKPRITMASIAMRDGHCTVETSKLIEEKTLIERMIHKFALPNEAIGFVARWDARQGVAPIAFELELSEYKLATSIGCTL